MPKYTGPMFGYYEADGKAACKNPNMVPYTTKTGRQACKYPAGFKRGARGPRQKIGGNCFWDSTRSKYYKKVNGRTRWLKTDSTCDNRGAVTSVDWTRGGYSRKGGGSAWTQFIKNNYKTVKGQNPGLTFGEIVKILSGQYRAQKSGGAMQVPMMTRKRARDIDAGDVTRVKRRMA